MKIENYNSATLIIEDLKHLTKALNINKNIFEVDEGDLHHSSIAYDHVTAVIEAIKIIDFRSGGQVTSLMKNTITALQQRFEQL